jgi:hypothetical protein
MGFSTNRQKATPQSTVSIKEKYIHTAGLWRLASSVSLYDAGSVNT